MGAYVEMIQREERRTGVPLLKHQAWSGAELLDAQMAMASGGASSTAAMGAGVTEEQFVAADAEAEEVVLLDAEMPTKMTPEMERLLRMGVEAQQEYRRSDSMGGGGRHF